MHLNVYAHVATTRALGPFERFALWLQGCPFRCPGCMAPEAQPFTGGQTVDPQDLAEDVLGVKSIEGITVSGGEPFAQSAALRVFLAIVKERSTLGIIVYSGYAMRELEDIAMKDQNTAYILRNIDLLVDGPFLMEKNNSCGLKGSSNQQSHMITERYKEYLHLYQEGAARRVEIHVDLDQWMLAGVPSQRQLTWWQAEKVRLQQSSPRLLLSKPTFRHGEEHAASSSIDGGNGCTHDHS